MSKEALAALLNNRQYRDEITEHLEREAKAHGLVVLFGYSDDCAEVRGAFKDELGAPDTINLHRNGVLEQHYHDGCQKCIKRMEHLQSLCVPVEFVWGDNKGYPWLVRLEKPGQIPVAEFDIYEKGERFCRGLVIDVKDLPIIPEH